MLTFDEAMKQLQAASARADESMKRLATVMAEASVLVQRPISTDYDEHTYTTPALCRAAGISPDVFRSTAFRELATPYEAKLGISRNGGRRPWLWSLRQVRRIALTRCIHTASTVRVKAARDVAEYISLDVWRDNTLILIFSSRYRATLSHTEIAMQPRLAAANELCVDLPEFAREIEAALAGS